MAVNKVVYAGTTIIDLTNLTVTPETLAEGVIAINAKGEVIVGKAKVVNTWDIVSDSIWNNFTNKTWDNVLYGSDK